ncbi:MAG: transposase [Akkermansia sp.]|nr:transposase [Akkermansia sp.]
MGNSLCKIYVHLIFHTKSGACVVDEIHLSRVFQYIGGVIRSLSGCALAVGGRPDHIHILTSLPVSKSAADFVRDIKSNTSKWIKGLDKKYKDFSWQEGYAAFSVSESNKEKVISYITNQKEHHKIHTSQEEIRMFMMKHGITPHETA